MRANSKQIYVLSFRRLHAQDQDRDGFLGRTEFYEFCKFTVLSAYMAEEDRKMTAHDPVTDTHRIVMDLSERQNSVEARLAEFGAVLEKLAVQQQIMMDRIGSLTSVPLMPGQATSPSRATAGIGAGVLTKSPVLPFDNGDGLTEEDIQ